MIRGAEDKVYGFYSEHSPKPESSNGHHPKATGPLEDEEVIRLCRKAKNAPKFERLFDQGDKSEYAGDDSGADQALISLLAFYTQDEGQLDRLFRQSALSREKWTVRADYRQRTIRYALENATESYSPPDKKISTGSRSEASNEAEDEEKQDRRNQSDRLIGYALADLDELFADQVGAPHALIDGESLPLNSRCYGWLRRLMWEEEERSVNGEALKNAAGTLSAHAEFSGNVRELHTRAAWHEGSLYYELEAGHVVKAGASGWGTADNPPVLFRRYPNTKPLPAPQESGDLDTLDGFVNLKTERDQRLFKAYAVTLPLPHVGRPILLATGVMGAGKTTASRVLKRLWDPTAPETVRLDPRDFLQKASKASIVMLDNQSGMPEWAADTLCRMVTGEADSKRRLYTDDEDVIFELRRAMLLNGINVPTERGDVLDRALAVELERIPDGERRTEEDLWEEFEAARPALLGAALRVLSQAIATKPSLKLSRRPRLADWGTYAAAVYEVMGWGAETFLEDWDEVVKVQNQATLDGSPVAQAIIRFMEDQEEYTGTSSELHKKLEEEAEDLGISVSRDKQWPKSARWLWRRIREVQATLSATGIEASRKDTNQATEIALRKNPTDDSTNSTQGESRVDKPDSSGIKDSDDSTSNSTSASNSTSNSTRNPADGAESGISGDSGIIYGDSSDTVSPSSRLAPRQSSSLTKLSAEQELETLLESRPDWLTRQARKCLEGDARDQLLKPLANTIAGEYLGNVRRGGEALPFVREHLEVLAS